MVYVLRIRPSRHTTLIEMTPAELRQALEDEQKTPLGSPDQVRHERVTANIARNYVKKGGHHETGLYVDMDGRVRYAKPDPEGH